MKPVAVWDENLAKVALRMMQWWKDDLVLTAGAYIVLRQFLLKRLQRIEAVNSKDTDEELWSDSDGSSYVYSTSDGDDGDSIEEVWEKEAEYDAANGKLFEPSFALEAERPSSIPNNLVWALLCLGPLYYDCCCAWNEYDGQMFERRFVTGVRQMIEESGEGINDGCSVTGLTPLLALYSSAWGVDKRELHKFILELTELLVAKGADVNAMDCNGRSVTDLVMLKIPLRKDVIHSPFLQAPKWKSDAHEEPLTRMWQNLVAIGCPQPKAELVALCSDFHVDATLRKNNLSESLRDEDLLELQQRLNLTAVEVSSLVEGQLQNLVKEFVSLVEHCRRCVVLEQDILAAINNESSF